MSGPDRQPTPVFTPSASIGGVEFVAHQVHLALCDGNGSSRLHSGPRGIAMSGRPPGRWMALTWKTQALAALRHPGTLSRGLLWLHGAELTRDSSPALTLLRSRTLNGADLLVAVSPIAVQLLPPGLRERVELVGPPIPATQRASVRAGCHGGGELRVLSVGRAVPRKGHDTAIEVARRLCEHSPVRLDVVGPGPDLPRLRLLAGRDSRPGLTIEVHGAVPDTCRDQLYAEAHVLLFLPRAEHGEFEGLGLVVLEAAARGCPAVVLDCGGSRYGVADGYGGVVLDAGSGTEKIALAVRELASSDHARVAAACFASRFALPAWQERVRALAEGQRPGWRWPSFG